MTKAAPRRRQAIALALWVIALIALLHAGLLPLPFVCGYAGAGVAFVKLARMTSGAVRVVAFNLAGLAFVLLAAEAWCSWTSPRKGTVASGSYTAGYFLADPDLGGGPQPSVVATSKKVKDGALVYDVTYTIGPDKMRVTPGVVPSAPVPAVLCYGDSYTFGEGLNDDETYPARLQAELGPGYRVFNRGFHGYGPHQMLRSIELKREAEAVGDARPAIGIFLGAAFHVDRVAGRTHWNLYGPKYTLNDDGSITSAGQFSPRPPAEVTNGWRHQTWKTFMSSELASFVQRSTLSHGEPRDEELMFAVIAQAAHVFEQRYGGTFIVVMSGSLRKPESQHWREELQKRGVTHFLSVNDVVPKPASWEDYKITGDGHPNALLNRILSKILADYIRALPAAP